MKPGPSDLAVPNSPLAAAQPPNSPVRLSVGQRFNQRLAPLWAWLGLDSQHQRFLCNALMLALILRIVLLPLSFFAGRTIGELDQPLWELIYYVHSRWDSLHYYQLAEQGYLAAEPGRRLIVFFPVFPWLLRVGKAIALNPMVPGLLINFCASVVAGYYLQALVALDHGERVAKRALRYFFLFPTAYFLCVPYTEALFLALTLGAWYSARQGRWQLAGIAGLLASLTRLQGLVLFPALLLEAWYMRRELGWRQWLSTLLVPAGFGLYLLLNWKVTGNPLEFTVMQRAHWGNHMVPPWEPVQASLKYLFSQAPATGQGTSVEVVRLASVILVIVTLLLGIRRLRPSYQLYAWAQFGMVMLSSWLMSLPRYLLCLFPLYIVYASLSDNEDIHQQLLMVSTLLMGALAFVYFTGYWAY